MSLSLTPSRMPDPMKETRRQTLPLVHRFCMLHQPLQPCLLLLATTFVAFICFVRSVRCCSSIRFIRCHKQHHLLCPLLQLCLFTTAASSTTDFHLPPQLLITSPSSRSLLSHFIFSTFID